MSVRLLLLGLLRENDLHGYEMKRIVETEMADWTSVAVGSIYFALDKLASDAFIEERETTREGGRPARTVYAITKAGRAEFDRLLRETWTEVARMNFPLDIGIAFMSELPESELRGFLSRRVGILEGVLAKLSTHQAEILGCPEVPDSARFIFSHHESHYRVELEWTKKVLAGLS